MLKPVRVIQNAVLHAVQFVNNSEEDSQNMNAIVNWLNQGQSKMVAWHNGTNIYVNTARTAGERMDVGDWLVRDMTNKQVFVVDDRRFREEYDNYDKPTANIGIVELIKEWKKDSKEALLVRCLYMNQTYRLLGETVSGALKYHVKYQAGAVWYKAGGHNPTLTDEEVKRLRADGVLERDEARSGFRLTQLGQSIAVTFWGID